MAEMQEIDFLLSALESQILNNQSVIEPKLYKQCIKIINQNSLPHSERELSSLLDRQNELKKKNMEMRALIFKAKTEIETIKNILIHLI
jgi:hypothetical protein